jgi:transmembrane sensor
MSKREASRYIDEAASDWAARLDRGPLTSEESDRLQAWLSGDRRCAGALMRARAYALMSESAQALGPDYDPSDFAEPDPVARPRPSRRRVLTWAGAGAGAVGASLVAFGVGMSSANATISTARGELRLIPLRDGSTVMLNTESRIRLGDDALQRHVTLLDGEAYFTVAQDQRRPFVVEVGGRRLHAARAGFRVRTLANAPVEVLVHDGLVELDASGWRDRPPLHLSANMQVALAHASLLRSAPEERPVPVPPDAVTRELAWREGKIAFEGQTLGQAAGSFARYSNMRIVIRDHDLAIEPISGLFAANDPLGFSRAVARIFDARVTQRDNVIILSHSGS